MHRCMSQWTNLLLLLSSAHALRGADRYLQPENVSDKCLPCKVVRPEVLLMTESSALDNFEYDLRCLTSALDNGSLRTSLALEGLPTDLLRANKDALEAGEWHICIQAGDYHVHHEQNRVLLSESPTIFDQRDRRLQQQSNYERRRGRQSLLAVRVSSSVSGVSPMETADEIEAALFGTGPNPDQLEPHQVVVNHYAAVSHGQLLYEPAVADIPGTIRNGVMEISIDKPFDETVDIQTDILPRLLTYTRERIGSDKLDSIDKIIFCLPTGAHFQGDADWTAFTYLWEPYSYYQRSRCTRLSVVMHELGHASGFQHSGTADGNAYNDKAGYMGYAVNMLGFPLKAFNGHKHHTSGWFINRSMEIDPFTAIGTVLEQRLVAFVHASDDRLAEDDVVLIKIGDWYLQYNRAKLYNVDAEEKDAVTITHALSDGALSIRKASLTVGQAYFEVMDASSNSLVVAVCEATVTENDDVIDYAVVRFHQGVANGEDLCSRQDVTDAAAVQHVVSSESTNPTDTENNDSDDMLYPYDHIDNSATLEPYYDNDVDIPVAQTPDVILEDSNAEENDSFLEGLLWPIALAAGGILLLCVSALFACMCRRNRKAPAPKIRRMHDTTKIDRCSTQDLSETEEMDTSCGSAVIIREVKV